MPRRTPITRIHKHTRQKYVQLNGRLIYLGRHDLPETRRRYHTLIAEWEANNRLPLNKPPDLTIAELCDRFWTHAARYYVRPDGNSSQERGAFRILLRKLIDLYGTTLVAQFVPKALKAVRQRRHLLTDSCSRNDVSGRADQGRIFTVFLANSLSLSRRARADNESTLSGLDGPRRRRSVVAEVPIYRKWPG